MVVALLDGALVENELTAVLSHRLAISDIVIWELAKLIRLGRLDLDLSAAPFQAFYRNREVFPVSIEVAVCSTRLDFQSDPADELIAATSIVHGIPLLTRDRKIRASKMVPFWT